MFQQWPEVAFFRFKKICDLFLRLLECDLFRSPLREHSGGPAEEKTGAGAPSSELQELCSMTCTFCPWCQHRDAPCQGPRVRSQQDTQGSRAGKDSTASVAGQDTTEGCFPSHIFTQQLQPAQALSVLHKHLGHEGKRDMCLVQHQLQKLRCTEVPVPPSWSCSDAGGDPWHMEGYSPAPGNAHAQPAVPVQSKGPCPTALTHLLHRQLLHCAKERFCKASGSYQGGKCSPCPHLLPAENQILSKTIFSFSMSPSTY